MHPRWIVASAAIVAEYLLFSFLFDAVELLPAALQGIGELAPLPLVVAVAFLILRASAAEEEKAPERPPTRRATSRPALLAAHGAAYAAFIGASFALRDRMGAAGDESAWAFVALWAALLCASLGFLLGFTLGGAAAVSLARRSAPAAAVAVVVGGVAWGAGELAKGAWTSLSRFTLHAVAQMLRASFSDVVVDESVKRVGTARFHVLIDPVCSGYEGMGLLAILVGAYVWTFRSTLRFPRALLLPIVALAGGFVANVARIAALVALGTLGEEDIALRGFHSKAGWLLFCAVALGVTALARRSRFFVRAESRVGVAGAESLVDEENPTARYLAPLLAFLATALVTGLAGDGSLDRSEILRIAAAAVALFVVRDVLRDELRRVSRNGSRDASAGAAPTLGLAAVVGCVVFALWLALDRAEPARAAGVAAGIAAQLDAAPRSFTIAWYAARIIGSVAIVPLVEELAFRGFLLRRIVAADFTGVAYRAVTPVAVLVSALAFGALHQHFVAGVVAGVLYALLVQRTGRLADAVIAHVVTNALIAAVAVAGGRLDLWA